MKKLTSLLIIMAMLITIIPAVFAAPESGEEEIDRTVWKLYDKSVVNDDNGNPTNIPWSMGVTTAEAYEGTRSMHVTWDDRSSTNNVGWPTLSLDTAQIFPAGEYTFSVYIKNNGGANWLRVLHANTSQNVALPYLADAGNTTIDKSGFGTAISRIATEKSGWYQYSMDITYTSPGALKFLVSGKTQNGTPTDIYVDNICFASKSVPTVNLLTGNTGTFELVEEEEDLPDLSEEEPDPAFWNIAVNGATDSICKTTMKEAYEGNRSLHFRRAMHNGHSNIWPRTAILTVGTTYVMTAFIKIKEQTGGSIKLAFHNWQGENIANTAMVTKEPTDKEGWWKYTMTAEVQGSYPNGPMIDIVTGVNDVIDIYVDNISIAEKNGTTVSAMGNKGTFESESESEKEPYEVSTVKLYETVEGIPTAVPVIGTLQSGKIITASVSVLNNDEKSVLPAQLVIGLYKDNKMESIKIFDKVDVAKADGWTTLTGEITLPIVSAEGEYQVRAFVWCGNGSLKPLSTDKRTRPRNEVFLGNTIIFGDSHSTFEGYIPMGYSPWYLDGGSEKTDVTDVSETWWRQLIADIPGSNLLRNDSWSGTTICHTGYNGEDYSSKSFVTRATKLIEDGYFKENQIDTIFIYGGTNDRFAQAPMGTLQYTDWVNSDLYSALPAFCYLLHELKAASPFSRIICVLATTLSKELEKSYQEACEHYGVTAVSITEMDLKESHPTIKGMTQIKNQILSILSNQ